MSGGSAGPEILYLGAADIAALGIGVGEVFEATAAILRQKALGRTYLKPKLAVEGAPGQTAQAMVAVAEEPPLSLVKWVGVNGGNAARGLPIIHATVVLSDKETGQPRTIMNGTWLTGVRTAACSAVGARYLARADAETVAFIGCGLQAHTHLAALVAVLPGLRRARLLGRSRGPVEALAAVVAAAGLVAEVVEGASVALVGADVVVSSVPAGAGLRPFLDPAEVAPGAFVTAVDLGRLWLGAGFRERFDVLATDDREQSGQLAREGKMVFGGPFDAELGELVAGVHPGRTGAQERTGLVFAGMALADLGLAALIDRRARAAGVGRMLPV